MSDSSFRNYPGQDLYFQQLIFIQYYRIFLFNRILWLRKQALENAQNGAEDAESYKDPTGHETWVMSRDLNDPKAVVGVHSLVMVTTDDPKKYGKELAGRFEKISGVSSDYKGKRDANGDVYAIMFSGTKEDGKPEMIKATANGMGKKTHEGDIFAMTEKTSWYKPDQDANFFKINPKDSKMSEIEFDKRVIKVGDSYNESVKYKPLPSDGKNEGNCHSLMKTILEKAGAANTPKDLPGRDPGIGVTLPDTAFGKK